jgi:hypothetical protein
MKKGRKIIDEQCRYCEKAQTGNDKHGHLTMFCRLWDNRISEVFPFDKCELFRPSGYDIWFDKAGGQE